jgi:hypothetical protein
MRSLTFLAIEFYQRVRKDHQLTESDRVKETKRLILNEVTRWKIKSLKQGNNYFFKPLGFVGSENSSPIELRLIDTETEYGHNLKFGDLNKPSDEDKYKWNDRDPNKMSKALFIMDVLENEVSNLLISKKIRAISFSPFDEDDLGDDRLSYFRNMFDKVNKKGEFSWIQDGNNFTIKSKK